MVPSKVPVITGRLGMWAELLPGAAMTTSNFPWTGPVPSTVESVLQRRAMTVQRCVRGEVISNADGHKGVPRSANPSSGEVAFRKKMTLSSSFLGLNVTRFFISSRRRHTRCSRDWSSDVCSSDLGQGFGGSQGRRLFRAKDAHG